jgi:hypothetical protein
MLRSRTNIRLCIAVVVATTLLLATPALAGTIEDRPCTAPGSVNRDNSGSDFIVGFMPNVGSPSVELHLTGDVATMVTVEYPVNTPSFTTTVAVTPGSVTIVTLPTAAANFGWFSGVVSNNAVRAFSPTADEFVAYMINRATATSDAALGLPIDTMGTEYIAYGYTGAFHGSDKGEFVVVAAFDDTEVTIAPSNPMINTPAGTFSVMLDRGEGFFVQSVASIGPLADITGSIITADRPVGLTTGNLCTNIPVGGTVACDHSFEVAQPVASWGNSTLAANLPNRPSGSLYRVLASQDNTTVERNGTVIGTINRGDFIDTGVIAGEQNFAADKPIYAVQYMTGSSFPGAILGDPAIGNLIPPDQYRCDYTFSTVGGSQFVQNFVTVVAHNADLGAVLLDGVVIPAASFLPIAGSDFSAATPALSDGVHSTSSPGPHGIKVEGYNTFDYNI